jgi:hypothetical protein
MMPVESLPPLRLSAAAVVGVGLVVVVGVPGRGLQPSIEATSRPAAANPADDVGQRHERLDMKTLPSGLGAPADRRARATPAGHPHPVPAPWLTTGSIASPSSVESSSTLSNNSAGCKLQPAELIAIKTKADFYYCRPR